MNLWNQTGRRTAAIAAGTVVVIIIVVLARRVQNPSAEERAVAQHPKDAAQTAINQTTAFSPSADASGATAMKTIDQHRAKVRTASRPKERMQQILGPELFGHVELQFRQFPSRARLSEEQTRKYFQILTDAYDMFRKEFTARIQRGESVAAKPENAF